MQKYRYSLYDQDRKKVAQSNSLVNLRKKGYAIAEKDAIKNPLMEDGLIFHHSQLYDVMDNGTKIAFMKVNVYGKESIGYYYLSSNLRAHHLYRNGTIKPYIHKKR